MKVLQFALCFLTLCGVAAACMVGLLGYYFYAFIPAAAALASGIGFLFSLRKRGGTARKGK